MSDDDRDIDIESDVGVFPTWQFTGFVLHVYFQTHYNFLHFILLQAENDSDSRTHARNSVGGSGYYSQVKVGFVKRTNILHRTYLYVVVVILSRITSF